MPISSLLLAIGYLILYYHMLPGLSNDILTKLEQVLTDSLMGLHLPVSPTMLTFVANSNARESPSVCAPGYASKDLATAIFTHFQGNSHFFDCSMDKWHQSALKEWIEKYGNSISQLLSLVILCLGLGFGHASEVASAQHSVIHNPD